MTLWQLKNIYSLHHEIFMPWEHEIFKYWCSLFWSMHAKQNDIDELQLCLSDTTHDINSVCLCAALMMRLLTSTPHDNQQTWCWWGTGEAGSVGPGHQAPNLRVPILGVAAAARTPCALWHQSVQTSSMISRQSMLDGYLYVPTNSGSFSTVSRASTVTHGSQLSLWHQTKIIF